MTHTTLRLGEINFVNALPFRLAEGELPGVSWETWAAPPTQLNQAMLQQQQLDASAVSSAFYLRHKDQFVMLEDLTISAKHPVESVLLFLPQGFEGVTEGTPVYVPDSSETSVALMQYILFRKTGVQVKNTTHVYPMGEGEAYLSQGHPVLSIGDEALLLKHHPSFESVFVVDLAHVWQQTMGLPFVFAVWVAQKSWAEEHPELKQQLEAVLQAKRQRFATCLDTQTRILAEAKKQCPKLSDALLKRYLTETLSYVLTDDHRVALSWLDEIVSWLDNEGAYGTTRNRSVVSV